MNVISNEDSEWNEISKNLPLKIELQENKTRDEFLKTMKEIVLKIRNHPYLIEQSEENEKNIKSLLYDISSMFYSFPHRINEIYRKNKEEKRESQFDICGYGLPTSHGYCANLTYLTLKLLNEYYMKQLDSIEYFIDNKGKLPKYLYGLKRVYAHPNNQFFIQTFKYITKKDKEKDIIFVPNYFIQNEEQII